MEKKRRKAMIRPAFLSNHYFLAVKLTFMLNICLFQASAAVYSEDTKIDLRTGYRHQLLDKDITFPSTGNIPVQLNVITGRVTDSKGIALRGVTVRIKGSSKGTTTDGNGRYKLEVPKRTSIEFSFLGYSTREIVVGDQPLIDVSLSASDSGLEEVVVVGYGSQRRKDIIGAVSSLNTQHIEEKPLHRVEQALIGQLPGVQVRQQTAIPGQGLSILIRGSGSINAGNDPLYVIDGFPLDVVGQSGNGSYSTHPLNNLNPSDIESIQVLKDAAAGAIYGSRAANGVVIVTTKRGKAGIPSLNLNVNTGVSQISRKLDLLDAEEWIAVAGEMADINWVRSGTGRSADQNNDQRRAILGLGAGAYDAALMPDERWSQPGHPGLQYIDWQDAIYRDALFQNYSLSANGASEHTKYYISGNYLNQQSTLVNTDYTNYGLRANVETKSRGRLKFGVNLSPSYSERNTPTLEGKDTPIMKIAGISPVVEADAGLNTGVGEFPTYKWSSDRLVSPYAELTNTIALAKNTRLLGTTYAEYALFPGAYLRSSINYDDFNEQYKFYSPSIGWASRDVAPGLNASGSYNGFRKQNFVNENTINYSGTFRDVHVVSAVAGLSYNWRHVDNFGLSSAGGFANDVVNTLNNAIANSAGITVNGSTSENTNTLFSYYSRLQYDYADKYLVSGTIRRDASSKFGSNYRWGTFPSVSVGWRISNENFLKEFNAIDELKLRLSWGKSGNDNIGNYNFVSTLASTSYNFGGNAPVSAPGLVAAGIANPNLKWETSDTYNLGIDAYLFKNRLSLVIDAYTKTTKDLLLNLPVLGASGFSSSLQNIGSVRNSGLEIAVQSVNIRRSDFEWSTKANIAFNKNEVRSLNQDGSPIYIPSAYSGSNAPYILEPGLPMFSYYVTKTQGILTQQDIDNASVAKIARQEVGDTKYQDTDGNGIINADDRVVYGHPNPDYTWGITNNFKYKNWDLSVHVYGQQGGHILSYFGRAADFSGSTTSNILGIWRDRWTAENQNYEAPRGKLGARYTVPNATSDWVYSTNFIRIQDITIGFNLGNRWNKSLFNNARIYVSLQNWFGWDKYRGGANPESQNTNVSGDGSYPIPGDYGAMPLNKTASFGINLSF
ncbi:SusC/RagA family TonB-linked outer membrane protein [Sphingobacterium pedocola]|nr:TonB-dependent receptor [Sphingobacterium pedocola]